MSNTISTSWFFKYQPKTIDEYVFDTDNHKDLVNKFLSQEFVDGNLLLTGAAGLGKSSLAAVLIHATVKSQHDLKRMKTRSVQEVDELGSWITAAPLKSKKKIVLFEEFDKISSQSMSTLKDGLLEKYQQYVTFIATSNYPAKIDPALRSRFTHLSFTGKNVEGIINRLKTILLAEQVQYDENALKLFIEKNHHIGLRNILTELQINSVNKILDFNNISINASVEEEIINLSVEMFSLMFKHNDSVNRRLIMISPLKSVIADQYAKILELTQFAHNINYETIFIELNERIHFLPAKVIISKYVNTIENKKLLNIHYLAFLYEFMESISEINV